MRQDNDRVKVIFLDADDTLWSIDGFYEAQINQIAAFIHGIYGTEEESIVNQINEFNGVYLAVGTIQRHTFPQSCAKACASLVPDISINDLLEVYRIADLVYDHELKVFQDTVPALIEFGQLGYKSVILTLGDKLVQTSKIFRTGIYNYVANTVVTPKKDTEFYKKVTAEHPQIERFIMVGDSMSRDINPAKEAGWTTIWVNSKEKIFDGTNDQYQVKSIGQVPRILKEIDK